METLLGMTTAGLRELLGPGEPAFRAQQLYDAIYRQRAAGYHEISNLPKALRESLAGRAEFGHPKVAHLYSSGDGTRRYLLELADGRTVETVLMPETSRDTLCISSQVGCAVECAFCLTASMGLERNLTAGEIVGQVLYVARHNDLWSDARRMNVVMMGQGEPLLNLPNVLRASELLCDPRGLALSPRRITVSTAGILPRIADFAAAPDSWRPKLAISLNASTEQQRQEIMPITKKWHLKDLLDACRAYRLRPWEHLTFEYVLLGGVNDSDADARRLARLVSQLRCKVNLIALNPGPEIPFTTPHPQRVEAFQSLVRRTVPCFVRRPRGLDIYAACGQLKRMATADEPSLVQIQ